MWGNTVTLSTKKVLLDGCKNKQTLHFFACISKFISLLAFLSSLPISVLRILDTEANKFYDRSNQLYDAALLPRGYTQHARRPYIDSEINHKRHYITVSFINRGMDFIDLPSIFRDSLVISFIPTCMAHLSDGLTLIEVWIL